MKNMVKIIKNEHKFLFFTDIVSLILGLSAAVILFCLEAYVSALLCMIPVFAVFLISFFSVSAYKKFKLLTKIISFILNSFVIILFQIILPLIFIFIAYMNDYNKEINDVKYYDKARKTISYQKGIEHFPNKIPENAKEIEFHKERNPWFESEAMMLKYSIDENTIRNELKKYKYIEIKRQDHPETSMTLHDIDVLASDNNRITFEGFTFYVISDRDHDNPPGHHFPFHYGIGVNEDYTKIIYYYTYPD